MLSAASGRSLDVLSPGTCQISRALDFAPSLAACVGYPRGRALLSFIPADRPMTWTHQHETVTSDGGNPVTRAALGRCQFTPARPVAGIPMFILDYPFLRKLSAEPLPPSVLLCPKEAWGGQRPAPVMVLDRACGQPHLFSLRGHVGGCTRAWDRYTFRREDGPACSAIISSQLIHSFIALALS